MILKNAKSIIINNKNVSEIKIKNKVVWAAQSTHTLWDLSNRQFAYDASSGAISGRVYENKIFNISRYYSAINNAGRMFANQSSTIQVSNVTNDGITIRTTSTTYGIAIPFRLENGHKYRFAWNSGTNKVRIGMFKYSSTGICGDGTSSIVNGVDYIYPSSDQTGAKEMSFTFDESDRWYYTVLSIMPRTSNIDISLSDIMFEDITENIAKVYVYDGTKKFEYTENLSDYITFDDSLYTYSSLTCGVSSNIKKNYLNDNALTFRLDKYGNSNEISILYSNNYALTYPIWGESYLLTSPCGYSSLLYSNVLVDNAMNINIRATANGVIRDMYITFYERGKPSASFHYTNITSNSLSMSDNNTLKFDNDGNIILNNTTISEIPIYSTFVDATYIGAELYANSITTSGNAGDFGLLLEAEGVGVAKMGELIYAGKFPRLYGINAIREDANGFIKGVSDGFVNTAQTGSYFIASATPIVSGKAFTVSDGLYHKLPSSEIKSYLSNIRYASFGISGYTGNSNSFAVKF